MLALRIITSLVAMAVFATVLVIENKYVWPVFLCFILFFALLEWARLGKFQPAFARFYVVFGVFTFYILQDRFEQSGFAPFIFGIATFFWVMVVPFILKGTLEKILDEKNTFAFLGWFILTSSALAMVYMKNIGLIFLLSVLTITILADVFAFVFGKLFGKNKLAPNISPGKTREGAIGGLVAVLLFNCAIVWYGQAYFSPLGQSWQVSLFTYWPLPLYLIWSTVLVALAIMGDLLESLLKRRAKVKDSGKILPGHGGILDRIDAHLAVLPAAAFLLWMTIPAAT